MVDSEENNSEPQKDLEDLLNEVERSKPLGELLGEIMEDELKTQFRIKEERKQRIIEQLVSASKIYEKMPLERLAIKLEVHLNEIFDLLEEIILNNDFSGIVISGKELIFKKVQKRAELDQKPVHVMKPVIEREPIKRKKMNVHFKVLGDESIQTPVETPPPSGKDDDFEITTKFLPVSGQLELKLTLANKTPKSLANVRVNIVPGNNLQLLRVKPVLSTGNNWDEPITIKEISPRGNRRIMHFYSVANCNPASVEITVKYTTDDGNRMIKHANDVFQLEEPDFQKMPEMDEEQFHETIRNLDFKGIRSYGIPNSLEPTSAYLIMKEILIINNFEFVGEKFNEDEGSFLGWFYASYNASEEQTNQSEFIVIAQVLNRKMEFFAMGTDPAYLTCGLSFLAKELRGELLRRQLITSETDLMELYCMSCGGTLPEFKDKGGIVECKFCKAKMKF